MSVDPWDGSTTNTITCSAGETTGDLSIVVAATPTGYIKFRWIDNYGVGPTTGTMPSGVNPVRTMSTAYQSFGTGSYEVRTYQFRLENYGTHLEYISQSQLVITGIGLASVGTKSIGYPYSTFYFTTNDVDVELTITITN